VTTPRSPEHAPKKKSLFSRLKSGLKSAIGLGKSEKSEAKAPIKEPAKHAPTIHAHKRPQAGPRDDKPRAERPEKREDRPRRDRGERTGDRPPRGRDRGERTGGRERGPREEKPVRENHAPLPPPPAPPVPEGPFPEAFAVLGLSPAVLAAIRESGYTTPTTIQEKSIPLILQGRDVIGASQTGTGKTAAFALPTLTRLGAPGKFRVLVLEPVRELAAQVVEQFEKYGKHTGLRTLLVHGGVGYDKQRKGLQQGVDVVVATPGRLLDFMGEGIADLRDVEVLILDEVDRMLDMGFLPDVRRIVEKTPAAARPSFSRPPCRRRSRTSPTLPSKTPKASRSASASPPPRQSATTCTPWPVTSARNSSSPS
jgi:ATP-dependent RNA helicase RhlE